MRSMHEAHTLWLIAASFTFCIERILQCHRGSNAHFGGNGFGPFPSPQIRVLKASGNNTVVYGGRKKRNHKVGRVISFGNIHFHNNY